MKAVLFIALFAFALAQNCQQYSRCSECTAVTGCNWCAKGSGTSFCTPAGDAGSAGCTDNGEQPDQFMTSPPQCYGGCQSLEYCSQCIIVPGCSWCFVGASTGCLPTGSSCTASAVNTCDAPCNARVDCHTCTAGNCDWCTDDASSASSTAGLCQDKGTFTNCPAERLWVAEAQCPALPPPNSAETLVATVVVSVAVVAALF